MRMSFVIRILFFSHCIRSLKSLKSIKGNVKIPEECPKYTTGLISLMIFIIVFVCVYRSTPF